MKLITHVPCFMLNTWPSQQVLKVSTLGFQTCLHTMESLRCDRLDLTLFVVSEVLQCSRHALFTIRFFRGRPWRGRHESLVFGWFSGMLTCLLWQSTQGFLRRVQKTTSHVLHCVVGHTGARASMCRQLVHQMMYRGLRRSCSATRLLAKLTSNDLIRCRCPVRFLYENALCNSVSDNHDRCIDSRQD
jgi:hypothetical protein